MKKLEKHYIALSEYKKMIDELINEHNIYNPDIFITLKAEQRAILDAYLKRFASVQDFLGLKIFSLLLDIAGIKNTKMSEVLSHIEKEGIMDSLES